MKTRIFVVAVLILSIAMFSTGAFAYFSSTRTITGSTISAGTLTLKLNNDCGSTWAETAEAWALSNIAPGDYIEKKICMKNTGTLDMGRVWYDWSNLLASPAGSELARKLIIIDAQDNEDGGINQTPVFNSVGIYTLYDLAMIGGSGPDAYSATIVYPFIPAGQTAWLYLKFQFDPNAGNEFQGTAVTYDLQIKGVQKLPGNQ